MTVVACRLHQAASQKQGSPCQQTPRTLTLLEETNGLLMTQIVLSHGQIVLAELRSRPPVLRA